MAINGNPAEGVYEILENIKKNCIKSSKAKQALALTFDIDSNDEEKIFLSVIRVIERIESLKKIASKMKSNRKDEFVSVITELEREIMNIQLNEEAYILKGIMNERRMMALKAIAMGLDICNQYSSIEENQIFEVREKITQLKNEINDLEISEDLKEVVIDSLNKIDLIVENAKLYGVDGIREGVENSFGSIMLNRELSEISSENYDVKETLKKVLNLFGSINTMVTFGKNVAPMLNEASEVAKKFFLS